ncbi:TPA: hypothetical protein N0F65_011165 [Lagenidium giganteum]|uniref:Uncharacterized protein n=1 Tax=Lagenidium giganteum TaxID=4803 RepID=A0AAV2Z3Z9_9STRA|nr:TPA: hypothetical protein N0F65_011165 [Lagenidium giganteum]
MTFDRSIKQLWLRLGYFIISYYLFLSDVIRGGLGIDAFSDVYLRVQPNGFVNFGPFAYPVADIADNTTNAFSLDRWMYKFDTTTVAMRTYVELLNVSSWPPCMMYREACPDGTIGLATVFRMLDSLVDGVQATSTTTLNGVAPTTVTSRVHFHWLDRLHHWILPQAFERLWFRTNRAMYYNPTALRHHLARGLCASKSTRPYLCLDFWVNFARTRVLRDDKVERLGTVFTDIEKRMRQLVRDYDKDDHEVDMLMIDSTDDYSPDMISSRGLRAFDVVTITRVRQCHNVTNSNSTSETYTVVKRCKTIRIEDYRYEGSMIVSDVIEWFKFTAALRVIGQTYIWCRLAFLFAGCHYARKTQPSYYAATWSQQLYRSWLLLLRIPSQVVIYSSFFPVLCYALAESIDAPMTHVLVAERYHTILGAIKIEPRQYVQITTTQMRNVWLFALVVYALVSLQSRSLHLARYAGVVGACKFAITIVSALSTMAHFRSRMFRNTSLISFSQTAESAASAAIRSQRLYRNWGLPGSIFYGYAIDIKMFLAGFVAISLAAWVIGMALRHLAKWDTRTVIWARTDASYATQFLWPMTANVIAWNGNFVVQDVTRGFELSHQGTVHALTSIKLSSIDDTTRMSKIRNTAFCSAIDLRLLSARHSEGLTTVLLTNLCMMTDPITFYRLRLGLGKRIAFLRSRGTGELHLLPYDALISTGNSELPLHQLEVVLIVRSNQLPWMDLLCCG